MNLRTPALLLAMLTLPLTLVPTASALQCVWNDRPGSVPYTVEWATGGVVQFDNGPICTVSAHPENLPPPPPVGNPLACLNYVNDDWIVVYFPGECPVGLPGGLDPLGCVPVTWRHFSPPPCPVEGLP